MVGQDSQVFGGWEGIFCLTRTEASIVDRGQLLPQQLSVDMQA